MKNYAKQIKFEFKLKAHKICSSVLKC